MILNRFCIDEDAAFEVSGVYSLKKSSYDIKTGDDLEFKLKRKGVLILTILLYF